MPFSFHPPLAPSAANSECAFYSPPTRSRSSHRQGWSSSMLPRKPTGEREALSEAGAAPLRPCRSGPSTLPACHPLPATPYPTSIPPSLSRHNPVFASAAPMTATLITRRTTAPRETGKIRHPLACSTTRSYSSPAGSAERGRARERLAGPPRQTNVLPVSGLTACG